MSVGGDCLGLGGPVDAVLFDYGMTLARIARPVEALDRVQRRIAETILRSSPAATAQLVAAAHDRAEKAVMTHEASGALEELDIVAVERTAFADVGLVVEDALMDECSRLLQDAWLVGVHLYADAVPALTALGEMGLRLGLCSNAAYRPASMHAQLAHLGLDRLLSGAVFSAEVGWRKPSPQLFTAGLDAIGATARSTVFVGDRLREDVAGARDRGMRTVLIDRGGGVACSSGDGGVAQPDVVISTLAELPGLLGTLRPS